MMIAHSEPIQPVAAPCPPRSVALVGRYAHQHLQDAMLSVAECDVVFVESIAHAYSKIKRVLPDLIIVCLSSDDPDGCQVLSMLALDNDTSQIPVLTFVTPDSATTSDAADAMADAFICRGLTSLN
jgi:CheY-like chemotaxis protein